MDDYLNNSSFDCISGPSFNYDADQSELQALPLYVPMPEIFHSLYDGPFTRCISCQADLMSLPRGYFVLRSFRREEPVTEYAICRDCNDTFWAGVSKESRSRIDAEFRQCVDLNARRTRLINSVPFDVETWIGKCLLTGQPRAECDSYLIMALCRGPSLAWGDWPWMRSGESQRQTWQLWSTESRGRYDDFVERFLGPTPSLAKELPKLLVPAPMSGGLLSATTV